MSDTYQVGDHVAVPGFPTGTITADLGGGTYRVTWPAGFTTTAQLVPRPAFVNPTGMFKFAEKVVAS